MASKAWACVIHLQPQLFNFVPERKEANSFTEFFGNSDIDNLYGWPGRQVVLEDFIQEYCSRRQFL
jgi:hypothetical protein